MNFFFVKFKHEAKDQVEIGTVVIEKRNKLRRRKDGGIGNRSKETGVAVTEEKSQCRVCIETEERFL